VEDRYSEKIARQRRKADEALALTTFKQGI